MSDNLPVHTNTLLAQIERLLHSDVPPERMMAVFDLFNRERERAQRKAFNDDLAGLQAEIFEVSTSGKNPTFRSAYAKLHDLVKETQPYRSKYGISIRFGTTLEKSEAPPLRDGWQRVVAIVSHSEGHWEEHYLDGPPDISRNERVPRSPVQSVGSTNTYLRRYLFMMVLNLVPGGMPEDDDGRGAVDAPITPEQVEEITKRINNLNLTAEQISNLLLAVEAQTIPEIPARNYHRIINTLNARIRRKEEENNGEN